MTVSEKYSKYRTGNILNGDIILVRGTSLLAKAICWGDAKNGTNAYFNHALVVMQEGERLLALESEQNGVRPDFLSQVILSSCSDFAILRPQYPQEIINGYVNKAFQLGESGIKYNYGMLAKILIKRKLGFNTHLGDNESKNICSVFAGRTYGGLFPLACYSKENTKQDFITPQDLIRFIDVSRVKRIDTEVLN